MTTTNRAKLVRLPIVLTQLRRRAGFKSQSAAAVAIQKKTGTWLNKAQLSHWERGKAKPSLASLLTFLEGLGYSLQDFQDELDRANGLDVPLVPADKPEATVADPPPMPPPPPAPPTVESDLARRVEALERRLRDAGD